ncbi:MAG: hypothetical protein LBT88_03925 [Oscillospiraceae bacterium]|jgi:hypothetical protein|nr:hypothetical protein [Oscillospiraceae bacterium]
MAKTKKRIISIFLVLAIALTFTVNAMAGSGTAFSVPKNTSKLLANENVNSTKCGVSVNISANYYSGPGYAFLIPYVKVGTQEYGGGSVITGGQLFYTGVGSGTNKIYVENGTMNSTHIDFTTGTLGV